MDLKQILRSDHALASAARRLRGEPDASFPVLVAKIKLTWRCNLRCGFCAIPEQGAAMGRSGEPLTRGLVVESLARLADQGLRKVHFSGGEVLLRDDIEDLLKAVGGMGLQVNLTTNGTLLDKDTARFLVEHRVDTVSVSIDGPNRKEHDRIRGLEGAWQRAWKGIERLRERRRIKGRGPTIAVNTVVTRRNIDRLPELYAILDERGVDRWRLLPVRTDIRKMRPTAEQWTRLSTFLPGWRPKLDRRLLDLGLAGSPKLAAKGLYAGKEVAAKGCFAPWFSLFVDADGSCFPCCTGRSGMPSFGNLVKRSADLLLRSDVRKKICSRMAKGEIFRICRSCDEFLKENDDFIVAVKAMKEEGE
jgi:MoaA/NifB/PqqE/SkfB family radical SAM enzyme